MKVMVAGEAEAGTADFSWTVPGELVHFPVAVCGCPDCGCERSLCGLVSHKATSVFQVRDLDMDRTTFTNLLWDSLERGGWVKDGDPGDEAWVEEFAAEQLQLASQLPVEEPVRVHTLAIPSED